VIRRAILLVLLTTGCGSPQPAPAPEAHDRAVLEARVAACDRGRSGRDCDADRRALAEARREDRLATYRQAM